MQCFNNSEWHLRTLTQNVKPRLRANTIGFGIRLLQHNEQQLAADKAKIMIISNTPGIKSETDFGVHWQQRDGSQVIKQEYIVSSSGTFYPRFRLFFQHLKVLSY